MKRTAILEGLRSAPSVPVQPQLPSLPAVFSNQFFSFPDIFARGTRKGSSGQRSCCYHKQAEIAWQLSGKITILKISGKRSITISRATRPWEPVATARGRRAKGRPGPNASRKGRAEKRTAPAEMPCSPTQSRRKRRVLFFLRPYPKGLSTNSSSTRRLAPRPSGVSLDATGSTGPMPMASIRASPTPLPTR